jgi:hypothetical protein
MAFTTKLGGVMLPLEGKKRRGEKKGGTSQSKETTYANVT